MEFDFSSQEELFLRVRPALRAKLAELKRLNIRNANEMDIWDYLVRIKWSKAKNLSLSDIVSDIMHLDNKKFSEYQKSKVEV